MKYIYTKITDTMIVDELNQSPYNDINRKEVIRLIINNNHSFLRFNNKTKEIEIEYPSWNDKKQLIVSNNAFIFIVNRKQQ